MNRLKHPLWWALAIFTLNMAVRLIHAEAYFMLGDEPFTVYFAQWPLADIYKIISAGNNPPTFEILMHGWMKIGGTEGLWLRLLPSLFVSLAAVALALLAQRLGGLRLLIATSVLFLLTNFQMDFAHTVRVYAMLICCSCWSMYFFIALCENGKRSNIVGWIITTLLALSSHYFGLFILFAQWLSIIASKGIDRKFIKRFTMANIVVLLLFSPLIVVAVKRYFATIDEGTFLTPVVNLKPFFDIGMFVFNKSEYLFFTIIIVGLSSIVLVFHKLNKSLLRTTIFSILTFFALLPVLRYFTFMESFLNFQVIESTIWALLSVLFSIALLIYLVRNNNWSIGLKTILFWPIAPLLFLWFSSFKTPMFLDRYMVHLLTAFSLLVPLLIFQLPRILNCTALILVVILFAFNFNLKPERISTTGMAEEKLKTMKGQKTMVILTPGYEDLRFAFHYNKDLFFNAQAHRLDTLGEKIIREENSTLYKEGIRRALRRENIHVANNIDMVEFSLDTLNDVILYDFNSFICYPDNGIKNQLELEFGQATEVAVYPEGIYLYHYKRQ